MQNLNNPNESLNTNLDRDAQDFIHYAIKDRIVDQYESISSLDTKAGITLGFIGAFLGGLVNSDWFLGLSRPYVVLTLFALGSAAALSLVAWQARDYQRPPEPQPLKRKYWDTPKATVVKVLTNSFIDAFERNKEAIEGKKKTLNQALLCFFIAIIIIMVALLAEPLSKNKSNQHERNNYVARYR